jgi:hypothetical protein
VWLSKPQDISNFTNIQSLLEKITQFKIPHNNDVIFCEEYCSLAALFDKTIGDTDNDFNKLAYDKKWGGTSLVKLIKLTEFIPSVSHYNAMTDGICS